MQLIKWEPFGEVDSFFNEFDSSQRRNIGWDLATDVYSKGNSIVVEMNLPGIDSEHIKVAVEDNHIRISGYREKVTEEKKKNYYNKEISRGSFERVIPLPEAVDKNKVKADLENGTLRVTLPKQVEKKASRVKVRSKMTGSAKTKTVKKTKTTKATKKTKRAVGKKKK